MLFETRAGVLPLRGICEPMRSAALEHWLTKTGDRVVRKAATAEGSAALDDRERLLFEYWLFDTEQRNGGVSQYFCNRGPWGLLSAMASPVLPSFAAFAASINEVIADASDPYEAIIASQTDLDALYDACHDQLVLELHAAARPLGPPEAVMSYDAIWTEAHAPKTGGTPCPKCGKPLRTARAQQCFICGAEWHGQATL